MQFRWRLFEAISILFTSSLIAWNFAAHAIVDCLGDCLVNRVGRNTTKAGIVIVELLLRSGFGCRDRRGNPVDILHSRDIIGRVRGLKVPQTWPSGCAAVSKPLIQHVLLRV